MRSQQKLIKNNSIVKNYVPMRSLFPLLRSTLLPPNIHHQLYLLNIASASDHRIKISTKNEEKKKNNKTE